MEDRHAKALAEFDMKISAIETVEKGQAWVAAPFTPPQPYPEEDAKAAAAEAAAAATAGAASVERFSTPRLEFTEGAPLLLPQQSRPRSVHSHAMHALAFAPP